MSLFWPELYHIYCSCWSTWTSSQRSKNFYSRHFDQLLSSFMYSFIDSILVVEVWRVRGSLVSSFFKASGKELITKQVFCEKDTVFLKYSFSTRSTIQETKPRNMGITDEKFVFSNSFQLEVWINRKCQRKI